MNLLIMCESFTPGENKPRVEVDTEITGCEPGSNPVVSTAIIIIYAQRPTHVYFMLIKLRLHKD